MDNYTKFEIQQADNVPVKEKIIRFFAIILDREWSEKLYNAAEEKGNRYGVEAFDEAIELICTELGLSSDELAKQISSKDTSSSN